MSDTYESEDGTFILWISGEDGYPGEAASLEKQADGSWSFREYTRVEEQEAA